MKFVVFLNAAWRVIQKKKMVFVCVVPIACGPWAKLLAEKTPYPPYTLHACAHRK